MMTRSDMQGHWEVAKIQRTRRMNSNQTRTNLIGLDSSTEFWRLSVDRILAAVCGHRAAPTWRMCAPNMVWLNVIHPRDVAPPVPLEDRIVAGLRPAHRCRRVHGDDRSCSVRRTRSIINVSICSLTCYRGGKLPDRSVSPRSGGEPD